MELVPDPARARHPGGLATRWPAQRRPAAGAGNSQRGAGAVGSLQRGLRGLVPSPPSLAFSAPPRLLPAKEAPNCPHPPNPWVPGGKSGSDF